MWKIILPIVLLAVFLGACGGDQDNGGALGRDTMIRTTDSSDTNRSAGPMRRIIFNAGPMAEDYGTGIHNMNQAINGGDSVEWIERQLNRVPTVRDAKVFIYGDSLVVGVDSTGQPIEVTEDIMGQLNDVAKYKQIFVTTDPILYQEIGLMKERINRREKGLERKIQKMINDIGAQMEPYQY